MTWRYTNTERTVVHRDGSYGSFESRSVADREVQEWIAAGNTPADPPDVPSAPPQPSFIEFDLHGANHRLITFERAGDTIPVHAHDGQYHYTLVTSGVVEAFDHDGYSEHMEAPYLVKFDAGRSHGIRAVSDGAIILHIFEPHK